MNSAIKDTFKGGLAFGLSSSLVSAIAFILIPIYTRYLSVVDFGLLGLISLTTSLFTVIFGLGMSSAIFRSYFDYEEQTDQKKLVGTAFLLMLFSGLILVITATIISEPIISNFIFKIPGKGLYFQVGLYSSSVLMLNAVPLAVYRVKKQFSQFAFINGIGALLQMIVIITLVVYFKLGIIGVVLGQLTSALVINIILFFQIRHEMELVIVWGEVKKLLAYGSPLILGSVFFILLNSGGLYFVQITLGLEQVAFYNLAMKFSSIMTIILVSPFQLIWLPMIFSAEKKEYANSFYSRILDYVTYISVSFGLILGIFSPEIIRLIATHSYESTSALISLLIFTNILFLIQNVFNVGIILGRKTMYWSLAIIIEVVLSIVSWIILAPRFGNVGIVIGSVVGYSVGVGATLVFSRRILKIKYEWIRFMVLLVIYPFGIVMANIIQLYVTNGLYITAFKTILIIICLTMPFMFRLWKPDEILALKHALRQATTWFNLRIFARYRRQR